MRAVAFLLLLTLAAPGGATAQGAACPNDTATAVAQAKAALSSSDTSRDRAALVCLTEAVAALGERITLIESRLYRPQSEGVGAGRLVAPKFDDNGQPAQ